MQKQRICRGFFIIEERVIYLRQRETCLHYANVVAATTPLFHRHEGTLAPALGCLLRTRVAAKLCEKSMEIIKWLGAPRWVGQSGASSNFLSFFASFDSIRYVTRRLDWLRSIRVPSTVGSSSIDAVWGSQAVMQAHETNVSRGCCMLSLEQACLAPVLFLGTV